MRLAGPLAVLALTHLVPDPPIWIPDTEFTFEDGGHYITGDGHPYHYDHDRHAWHYGRTHEEGVRWEQRRQREHPSTIPGR